MSFKRFCALWRRLQVCVSAVSVCMYMCSGVCARMDFVLQKLLRNVT